MRRINKILKDLPETFSFYDFAETYKDKLLATTDVVNFVMIGYLKQIVRVALPSGKYKEYGSIIDIPDSIYDVETGTNYSPDINDISVFYSKNGNE